MKHPIPDTQFPDMIDTLFIHGHLCTMAEGCLSEIRNGALAVTNGIITWVGKEKDLPKNVKTNTDQTHQIIDCKGGWILPGFIDCHTHLVWAGSRSKEFESRLKGATYEQIAKKGGGINATVAATRNATPGQLFDLSSKRLKALMQSGVTTVEIKSGYGLNLETELKILDVISQLDQTFPVHIEPTFLGAHALPPEFKNNSDNYIDIVTNTMLPAIKKQGIATAVDVFCEQIGFSHEQTKRVFKAARDLGFQLKLHAEQLSDSKGTGLAAQFKALSCDHLEYLSLSDAQLMAKNNVTAVLLPGAFYYLNETQKPPIQTFRDLNISMALATDLNPGTSPIFSIPLILNMACTLFGMTCEESLLGATINGAKALGLENKKGSIELGKDADLVIWDIDTPADLCYAAGTCPIKQTMINGKAKTN